MKIRKLDRRGEGRHKVEWLLDYYEGPKRIRKWFASRGQAEAAAEELQQQHKHTGQSWLELSPEERNDLMLVASEARQRKVTLRQVWEAYRNGNLDAQPMQRCTLGQAIEETLEWRRGENLRERYLQGLGTYLNRFAAGRMEMFVDQVGVADIQDWFNGRGEALSTKRANIGRLGSLFDVAWKKGYIRENPCLRLPAVKLRQEAPRILTVEEAKTLLNTCRKQSPALLGYIVLATFAGVRPEELEKLRWSDLDLKHGTLRIDSATSKTNRRRLVHLHQTALAWLKRCDRSAEFIAPGKTSLRRYRRHVCKTAGIQWEQDILRHSAGSYLLALHKNAHEVAVMLGNSARILEMHYKDLVNETDCKRFWALTPSKVGAR